ncbi:hypothetical protein C4K88_15165 [Arthrobacter pityocampae]|uniref:Lipoprotein n=1 Tax=Arthrobacter pityocampae TaxID=547334 RepID=A0A2S5IUQ4_9MICC|nr:hypothetical protein [Arthrobacter pityocampae]PPB48289.1 hypothetical protein C4K88_15165 [Arthrobacter pityocampae]
MKKLLTLTALLLALTACGSQEPSSEAAQQPAAEASQAPASEAPQQLSTEETCAELEESFGIFESEDPTDEQIAALASQLDDLATRASDPLQDSIGTLGGLIAKGKAALQTEAAEDPAVMEQFEAAIETAEKECGL